MKITSANYEILNLTIGFDPLCAQTRAINANISTFPGGERHIKLQLPEYDQRTKSPHVMITTRLQSGDDVMLLFMATDALRRSGIKEVSLFVPYLPYARQDRAMTPGESLSLKVMADLLNAQNYEAIFAYDVHSDCAGIAINNLQIINNHTFVKAVLEKAGGSHQDLDQVMRADGYWLIAPDAGAAKKVYPLAHTLGYSKPVITATKVRDVADKGRIIATELPVVDLMGMDCFIIDDICDGGGTFGPLAEQLKKQGAGRIFLVVSHGIFSKGLDALSPLIDHIFCTDSFDRRKLEVLDHIWIKRLSVVHLYSVI